MDHFARSEPFDRFAAWLKEAEAGEPNDPNAMALATADAEGRPSLRMVLLKGHDDRGFVFYTNLGSPQATDLAHNPRAALCLYWKSQQRQVRIAGRVEPVADDEADAYFASRARDARIGAWASDQSRPLEGRSALERRASCSR